MEDLHSRLRGVPDINLINLVPSATHQHYKGGLYQLLGEVRDADTGEPVRGKDGRPRVLYRHVYPYASAYWERDASEFEGTVTLPKVEPLGEDIEVPRFRLLGS